MNCQHREKGARDRRASDTNNTCLTLQEAPHAIALDDCPELASAIMSVMPDWTARITPETPQAAIPVSRLCGRAAGIYEFTSFWSSNAIRRQGQASAVCGAVADAVQAYCDARSGTFGLHCGAVQIGGHLVAFTGTYRAGKTTLVTRLGMEPDTAFFCDDVLPIRPDGRAVALGIQSRLRLPLPNTAAPDFRDRVARSITVSDARYAYVRIADQVRLGHTAPLAALVLLSRQEGAPARFHQLPRSIAAACLIRQNIADPGEVDAHYDRLSGMVDQMVCLSLVYSDIEDAVALIRHAFEGSAIPAAGIDIGPPLPADLPEVTAEAIDPDRPLARSGDVLDRVIGTDTFLWQVDARNWFSLNPVGAAVWQMLETPVTPGEVIEVLSHCFTDVDPGLIEADVIRLLGQMVARGLVLEVAGD